MGGFDVLTNSFYLLGVSVRSTRDDISEAYEDALFDGKHDEQILLQANQALAGPKTRLEAELSWLPELSPSRAREVVKLIEGNPANLSSSIEELELPSLSAANVYASLVTRFPGDKDFIVKLIASYEDISDEKALKAIDETRRVSGFLKADPEVVLG